MEASLPFPTFPRFCGQTFLEGNDMELGLACVQAYNDWMVEEWCAPSGGALLPLCIIPMWDAELAAAEVLRNAARGVRAVCFSEIPTHLGLPSIHTGFWDPFFAACNDTGTTMCMHIGSSSKMPSTSTDAPPAVGSTLTYMNAAMSLTDWLMSGVFERFPRLRFGFMESPNVARLLNDSEARGLPIDADVATVFVGHSSVQPTGHSKMAPWRKRLFAFMNRNAQPAALYYGLHPEQVVEIGVRIEI